MSISNILNIYTKGCAPGVEISCLQGSRMQIA